MYYSEDDDDNEYHSENEFHLFPNIHVQIPIGNRAKQANLARAYIEKLAMAECNAAKLIAEEEKEKTQTVKKKEKKRKKRDKKQPTQQRQSTSTIDDSEPEEEEVDEEDGDEEQKCKKPLPVVKNSRKNIRQEEADKEEEALDPSCAFISEVAVKKKIGAAPDSRNKNKKINPNNLSLQLKRMIEDALRLVEQDCYEEAANVYTKIIEMYPMTYAFYGNRSYCNERLGKYAEALLDANKSLSLNSKCSVNHYRKASALFGLKKFDDAETALCRVLKLDPKCIEAKDDLVLIKKIKLLDMGFNDRMSDFGARNYETLDEAIAYLVNKSEDDFQHGNVDPMNEIYASEDEDTDEFVATIKNVEDPLELNPTNPRKLKVLWVGNLSPDVSEQEIKTLFSKYGPVERVAIYKGVQNDKNYAFINFKDSATPGKAMVALQGRQIGTSEMLIKFPIRKLTDAPANSTTDKKFKDGSNNNSVVNLMPVNGGECWFWRARGFCYHEKNCRYEHIKAHRNIDRVNNP